jgi:ribonuclease VapC
MIVDSSALVSIIGDEDDAAILLTKMRHSDEPIRLSAANYLEAAIVLDGERFGGQGYRLDELIRELEIEIAPVTEKHAKIARQAYQDFGKGSGHSARLNFGDCLAYALAAERGEPLLFKGDDFSHTGIRRA